MNCKSMPKSFGPQMGDHFLQFVLWRWIPDLLAHDLNLHLQLQVFYGSDDCTGLYPPQFPVWIAITSTHCPLEACSSLPGVNARAEIPAFTILSRRISIIASSLNSSCAANFSPAASTADFRQRP